jgi:hypothetical protein
VFIGWILDYVKSDAEFRLALHLHEGNSDEQARDHWRGALDLPQARFHKTFIKPKGTGHRKNTHVHGVCTVKIMKCADAWQTISAWLEVLPDYLALGRAHN